MNNVERERADLIEKNERLTQELAEISQQLLEERSRRQDESQSREQMFLTTDDAMIIVDAQSSQKRFNPAFSRMIGYSQEELEQMSWAQLVHPEDMSAIAGSREQLKEKSFLANFENRYVHKNGKILYLKWTLRYSYDRSKIIGIARDTTELRAQKKHQDEQRQKSMVASKMHVLGRMAAGVAHEINNPLAVIYGQAHHLQQNLITDHPQAEKIKAAAVQIEKMSMKIVDIINRLRTFAREGSNDPLVFVPLAHIVSETTAFCRDEMLRSGIKLTVAAIPPDLEVYGRSSQISQVLLNLLNNAMDAVENENPKIISVDLLLTENYVGLAVQDNGRGIDGPLKAQLFEPFFTTKALGKGTGLGLSVSKEIIEAHGGSITYEPMESTGARFVFLLPRVI